MNYQQILFKLRKKHSLTQRQMAKVLRVNHGTVALWETGKRTIPGPVTLIIDNFEVYLERIKSKVLKNGK